GGPGSIVRGAAPPPLPEAAVSVILPVPFFEEPYEMKKEIHPEYHPVMFGDPSVGAEFVTRSTMKSAETRDIDGVKHFVIKMEISSASHPFFTGSRKFISNDGRV